jgi:hypothetical protein
MKVTGLVVLIKLISFASGATRCTASTYNEKTSGTDTLGRRMQQVTPIFSVVVNNSHDPLFDGLNIPANAAQAGMWSGVNNWPIVPVHAAVLLDGRMSTYGTPTGNGAQDGRTFVFWDPKQGVGNGLITIPNAQHVDSFCGSGAMLPSGKFLAAGGASIASGFNATGVTIIDPITSTPSDAEFTNLPPRWYSTLTSLPDGRKVLSGGGVPYFGTSSTTPEVFTQGQGWQLLTGAKSEDAFGSTNSHFWFPPSGYPTISSQAATTFDITGIASGNVVVKDTAPMNFQRQWPSCMVLPNGKVLVTGGSTFADDAGSNSVLAAEIWDPASGSWTVGASQALYRGYHSESVLLPNGIAYVGGGGVPGPLTNFNFELYYPPYLFTSQNGASVLAMRPTIVSLSNNTGNYGGQLQLQLAPGDDVAQVLFMTLPSVTHSFDSDMRRMTLSFQLISNGVQVTLPSSANLAPPGYHYINVINGNGVPSTAVIIGLDAVAPPATLLPKASPAPTVLPATGKPSLRPSRLPTPVPVSPVKSTHLPTKKPTRPPTLRPTPRPTSNQKPHSLPPTSNPKFHPVAPPTPSPTLLPTPALHPPLTSSPSAEPQPSTPLQAQRISVGSDGNSRRCGQQRKFVCFHRRGFLDCAQKWSSRRGSRR